jgi:hypothetical protein
MQSEAILLEATQVLAAAALMHLAAMLDLEATFRAARRNVGSGPRRSCCGIG